MKIKGCGKFEFVEGNDDLVDKIIYLLQHSLKPYFKITKIEYNNEIIKQFSPLIENTSYASDSEKFSLFALLDTEKLQKA